MNQECRLIFPVRTENIDVGSIINSLSISGNVAVTSTELCTDIEPANSANVGYVEHRVRGVYFVIKFIVTTSNIPMAINEVTNICVRATR